MKKAPYLFLILTLVACTPIPIKHYKTDVVNQTPCYQTNDCPMQNPPGLEPGTKGFLTLLHPTKAIQELLRGSHWGFMKLCGAIDKLECLTKLPMKIF